jgi:hypothetical protein
MDYYHQFLRAYLTDNRQELVDSLGRDDFFSLLQTRSEAAAAAFEQARLGGHDVNAAQELAIRVLVEGLESDVNHPE